MTDAVPAAGNEMTQPNDVEVMQAVFERDDGKVFLYFDARESMQDNAVRAAKLAWAAQRQEKAGLPSSGILRSRRAADRIEVEATAQPAAKIAA